MSVTKPRYARNRGEQGQSLPMLILMVVVIILFVGLGLDVGFAYLTRAALSKAVDAGCMAGVRSLSTGTNQAVQIADSTFALNYTNSGVAGRSVAFPTGTSFFSLSNNNWYLSMNKSVQINTFFIRVLPNWKTMTVAAHAQSIRPKVVLSLVLDRSGSMDTNGGGNALPGAVATFINFFDDAIDRASMSSFSYAARTDVAMVQPFKTAIKNKANALSFAGWTASEQGLEFGRQQNLTVTPLANEEVIKVIVFMTDGLANTFKYTFNCGDRNMGPDRTLYDPVTGNGSSTGCTIPNPINSVNGGTVSTTGGCGPLTLEAQARAEAVAKQARLEGNYVYCIGLGDPNAAQECNFPPLNIPFLQRVANEDGVVDPDQPQGGVAIAANPNDLPQAFADIANRILLRLTR